MEVKIVHSYYYFKCLLQYMNNKIETEREGGHLLGCIVFMQASFVLVHVIS